MWMGMELVEVVGVKRPDPTRHEAANVADERTTHGGHGLFVTGRVPDHLLTHLNRADIHRSVPDPHDNNGLSLEHTVEDQMVRKTVDRDGAQSIE